VWPRSTVSRRVLAHDGPDVLTSQRRFKQMRLQSIDNLKAFHLAGAGEQIDQNPVEGQRRKIALLQLADGDFLDEIGVRVGVRIGVVESVDVLDQRVRGTSVALRQQERAGVGAMRRDAAQTRRMLPDREWRIAVADDAWGRLDKERQHVPKDFRRD